MSKSRRGLRSLKGALLFFAFRDDAQVQPVTEGFLVRVTYRSFFVRLLVAHAKGIRNNSRAWFQILQQLGTKFLVDAIEQEQVTTVPS